MTHRIIGIIPARMESTRFPGKPLAPILGIPMIEHVYRRVSMCQSLESVYVATCNEEIRQCTEDFGGNAIMTSTRHQRASDRVAEAAQNIEADIVVMIQGDEPMTVPEMIDLAIEPMLDDDSVKCVNLSKRIESEEEFLSPNTIKVSIDREGNALYFSREPIPTRHILGFGNSSVFKQVCIIPFRNDMLETYAALEQTPLEKAESVDMLRLMENGYKVRMVNVNHNTHAVDTPEDLNFVASLMRDDPLIHQYSPKSRTDND